MNAKYIVIEYSNSVPEAMLIFPREIGHKAFAVTNAHPLRIISAGFIMLKGGEFVCHGESISLELKSRTGEDSALANQMFGRE